MKELIIEPTGGLCNRLRVIFSYKRLAEEECKKLVVVWKTNEYCNGEFLDHYQEVEGISFVKNCNSEPFYRGCSGLPNPDYSDLRVKKEIMEEILRRKSILGAGYISAHIRRTDHVKLAEIKGLYTEDEIFIKFFKENSGNIFIATDNPETQIEFKKIFTNRLFIFNEIEKTERIRMTSLRESIIDINLCIESSNFIGTRYSSFSGFIENLRKKIVG